MTPFLGILALMGGGLFQTSFASSITKLELQINWKRTGPFLLQVIKSYVVHYSYLFIWIDSKSIVWDSS